MKVYTIFSIKQQQIWTNVRARIFNVGLLTKSQFTSGRPGTGQLQLRFSVVFLGPRANAELVHKFHVALSSSHAALILVTLKMSP
jgi:hypothetical protein